MLRVDPVPAAWNSDDVGLPGVPGYASYNSATSTFTVAGSGNDIGKTGNTAVTSDSFQFLYQTLSGNGSIIARVASQTNTDANAKAGVMIRESLDGGSRFADLVLTPSTLYAQSRTSTGGNGATNYSRASTTAPYWVQLLRSGDVITFKRSSNGTTWTVMGTVTISSLATNVYIGLATTSHNNVKINPATFTNVSFTGTLNPGPNINAGLPVPGSLSITDKTSTSVSLSWGNVSGETGFTIERSRDGVNYTQIGTTGVDVTTYINTGLSDAQRYYYQVRSQGSSSTVSNASNIVTDITRAGAVSHLRIISLYHDRTGFGLDRRERRDQLPCRTFTRWQQQLDHGGDLGQKHSHLQRHRTHGQHAIFLSRGDAATLPATRPRLWCSPALQGLTL